MTAKDQPSQKPATSPPPSKNPDAVDPRLLGQEKRGTEPTVIIVRTGGSGTKQDC
jgi:hypothetical protein